MGSRGGPRKATVLPNSLPSPLPAFQFPPSELVHEDDFELLGRTMDEAFSEVFQDRRVTVSIEEKDKRKFYKIERKLYDESGQHRGSLSMSGGTALSERYRHLFGENP